MALFDILFSLISIYAIKSPIYFTSKRVLWNRIVWSNSIAITQPRKMHTDLSEKELLPQSGIHSVGESLSNIFPLLRFSSLIQFSECAWRAPNKIKLGEVSHLNVNCSKPSLMARQKPRKYNDYIEQVLSLNSFLILLPYVKDNIFSWSWTHGK